MQTVKKTIKNKDLLFANFKKLKKQGFNLLQTLKAKRTWISLFASCQKSKKNKDFMFYRLQKAKKTKIYYLQTLKIELKKWILILQTV